MQPNKKKHRFKKIILCLTGGLLVLLVAFHFWFVNHAEELIENLVNSKSNGRLELKIEKFKFNWLSRKFELRQVTFTSSDTINTPNRYQLDAERIRIQVKSLWPLIFKKQFLIDSLQVISPSLTVTRMHASPSTAGDTSLSIPQEMGRVYRSIQDALEVLQVDRFAIDNGTFALVNNMRPQDHPIRISRIFFKLDNLSVDSSLDRSQQKILFSDNVSLHTSNQDILFPDGRHRLSFSNFRVNVLNRVAEFDSCTISATRGDSSNNNFQIFFDRLQMTNINFDTLYQTEVIKADSVYCINPRFKLDIDLQKKQGPIKPPKVDELIQQMTGNMQLAFVVVQNGSFDINTMRDGRPSSFTSDHNNFDLQGLSISQKAPQPVTIERFAMAIRNYENFLRDSSYSIRFDSILINNNRISLGNFSYRELDHGRVVNSLVMPQFELHGLSWDALIADQQLKADRVNLYSPVINYTIKPDQSAKSQDVFQTLAGVGNIIRLQNLHIRNGQVNLLFNNNTRLSLDNTYLSVSAEQLVNSRKIATIQRSVDELHFRKGVFTSGKLRAMLTNAKFTGGAQGVNAEQINVTNGDGLSIDAKNVGIRQLLVSEQGRENVVSGITWTSANVKIDGLKSGDPSGNTAFTLNDINGTNTTLRMTDGEKKISVVLDRAMVSRLVNAKGKLQGADGMKASGHALSFTDGRQSLSIPSFTINDLGTSTLSKPVYQSQSPEDSMLVSAADITLVPDLNAFLKKNISSSSIVVNRPVLDIFRRGGNAIEGERPSLPVMNLEDVKLIQPKVNLHLEGEKGLTTLAWDGTASSNSIALKKFRTYHGADNYISLDQLKLSVDQFIFTDTKGNKFNARDGHFNATLDSIIVHRNETDDLEWGGKVADLMAENFKLDSLGKHNGLLDLKYARLNDLRISSANLISMREMASQNQDFRIREVTGSYDDELTHYNWSNMAYDKRSRVLSVDSFDYHPTATIDEFRKKQVYQADYITMHTGAVKVGPFDLDRYIRDTVLDMGTASISDGYMSSYRDKRIPIKPGLQTLLPTNMIKRIPVHLVVDTVRLHNASVDYEETNDKNGQTGKVTVTSLNGTVAHLRNYGLDQDDSLVIRASGLVADALPTDLEVHASYLDTFGGFVMKVIISRTDLRRLNPVLRPLASAELKSGSLDTLVMEVRGREHHAYGDITMFYDDLNVRVVRSGSQKKTFMTGVITFFANTLIKNRNTNRHSKVYFRRMKEKSAINYLVKITMNGVVASIGLKRNSKQTRAYKKEAMKRGIPFFEGDFK